MVVGSRRERAQRTLAAISSQTAVESIEAVLVDIAPRDVPRLEAPPTLRTTYLSRPDIDLWGRARAEGVRAANADVVAFIEDHAFPDPRWAEALIAAHEGPWAAVGYAFMNGNPESYVSRSAMLAHYGLFAHPATRGPARFISGSNVSYKRDVLLELGPELDDLLAVDFTVQGFLRDRGLPMFVESGALVAHEQFARLRDEWRTVHPSCRLLAAERARVGAWGSARRIVYGLATPLGAPVVKVARLAWSLRSRRPLWRQFVLCLPGIVAIYLWEAVGESLGYLLGVGDTDRQTVEWELEAERAGSA
jgi:hypothetical protein